MAHHLTASWDQNTSTEEWFVTNTMYNPNNGDPLLWTLSLGRHCHFPGNNDAP